MLQVNLSIVNKNKNKFETVASVLLGFGGLVITFLNSSFEFEDYLKSTWSIILITIFAGINFYYFFIKNLPETKEVFNKIVLILLGISLLIVMMLVVSFKVNFEL